MEKRQRLDLMALSTIPLVMTLGNSMLIPILPTIEKKLNLSGFQVSLIITVFSVVAILCIPIAGFLSDKYGRKKIIVPSIVITGLGGLVAGFAAWKLDEPFMIILLGRVLQGIGSSGAAPVVMPFVGDIFKKGEDVSKGLGIIETSNTFGKVLSPIIGALFATIIWYLPFFAIPVFSLISVLLVIFLVENPKEQEQQQKFPEYVENVRKIFKREGKWLFAIFISGAIIMFILFGILFYLSELLEQNYDMKGILKGAVLAIPLLSLSTASYFAGKKIGENKTLMKWCIVIGMVFVAGNLAWISFFEQISFLLIGLFLAGIGIGISLPALDALIADGIEKEERGTVTSFYSSMRFIGVALGPPVAAITMKNFNEFIFLFFALFGVVTIIICLILIKPEKEEKANQRLKPV